MMDKVAKERWIAALRSGEYVQGQASLRSTDIDGTVCHCCLGVLAETNGVTFETIKGSYFYNFENDDSYMNDIQTPSGYMGLSNKERATLMNMNDGVGYERRRSFLEIADYIEENL